MTPFTPLTQRQIGVLFLLAQGLTFKETARWLGLSHETVRDHVGAAQRRLGTHNLAQTLILALAQGQIPFPYLPEPLKQSEQAAWLRGQRVRVVAQHQEQTLVLHPREDLLELVPPSQLAAVPPVEYAHGLPVSGH